MKRNPRQKSIHYRFWQCLAMMPGTSRSAASIIGGLTQGLNRKAAAEFSFFLAVPTMLAVTVYSVFVKTWGEGTANAQKGYEMILASNDTIWTFIIGNIVAFVVAMVAVKTFINVLTKYGFRFWGWYRIVIGIALLIFFTFSNKYTSSLRKRSNQSICDLGLIGLHVK